MAVPKRRTSRSVSKQRRSHQKLSPASFISCSNCQELILPHQVCPKCGHYRGRQVLTVED